MFAYIAMTFFTTRCRTSSIYQDIMKHYTRLTLRQINNLLSLVVAGLAMYILLWPLLPAITWRLSHLANQPSSAQITAKTFGAIKKQDIPKSNTLVVPRLDMNLPINEGSNNLTLEKGTWRRPKTSTPDKGGNTVIVGHRFTYSAAGIFYHLDKIRVDDPIVIYWQGKEYDYKVISSTIVPATQLSVEDDSKDARLTLYTCAPLWSFKDRLVVVAKPWQEKL